ATPFGRSRLDSTGARRSREDMCHGSNTRLSEVTASPNILWLSVCTLRGRKYPYGNSHYSSCFVSAHRDTWLWTISRRYSDGVRVKRTTDRKRDVIVQRTRCRNHQHGQFQLPPTDGSSVGWIIRLSEPSRGGLSIAGINTVRRTDYCHGHFRWA